jgi:hypothetical protein
LASTGHDGFAAMTERDNDPREPTRPDDPLSFDEFEVETEALPDGRKIHYYRWPAADPDEADV